MPHPSFHPSFRRRALLVACMTVVLSALLSGCTSSKDMKVGELSFPDEALREAVLSYDENGDSALSEDELASVTCLGLTEEEYASYRQEGVLPAGGLAAASLEGIENLPALKAISLSGEADSVTVSGSGSLELVCVRDARYETIRMNACPNLTQVDVSSDAVAVVSLDDLASLEDLRLSSSNAESLEILGCESLTTLDMEGFMVASFDLSSCPSVEVFECHPTTVLENIPSIPFDLSDQDRGVLLSMADCLAAAGFGVPAGTDIVAADTDGLITSEALHRAKRAREIGRNGESGYELWPYSAGETMPREAGESLYHALFSKGLENFCQVNDSYFKSTDGGWVWLAGADDPVGYTESLSNVVKTPRGIEFDLCVVREGALGIVGVTYWHAVVSPCEDNVTGYTYKSLVKTSDDTRSFVAAKGA